MKTYKQWFDYHYKRLKKTNPTMSETSLKILAGDMAQKSINEQKQNAATAEETSGGMSNRVGPEASTMPIPAPTATPITKRPSQLPAAPTPTPTPTATKAAGSNVPPAPTGPSYNERLTQRIIANGGTALSPGEGTVTTNAPLNWVEFMPTLDNAEYVQLQKVLKKLGYNVKNKYQINEVLSIDFVNLFPVRDVTSLISKLNEFVLPGAGEEDKLPLRQISDIDRGALVDFARSIVEDTLMMERLPTEVENEIVDKWLKKAKQGVVTMPTKKVRNPKTGKLENVVETKRAFDEKTEGQALAERLKTMFPDQYQLAQGINFANELKKVLAGGQ